MKLETIDRPQIQPLEDWPVVPENPLAAIYDKAIELLETEGWIKGAMRSRDGFCMLGALAVSDNVTTIAIDGKVAIPSTSYYEKPLYRNVVRIIRSPFPRMETSIQIARWNDAGSRTKEEVIAALKAAKQLGAQG